MAYPKLLQKLFQDGGAGKKLNASIMPYDYARTVNGREPDATGNINIPARIVGDEWHSFTGQIPAGGVPYCGQEVTRATYADLWAYAQNNGLVKTESEWQALNTSQNGNVPYYSDGDGSTTFRMPKVVGYIKGAVSQAEAGTYTAEGLPNITGTIPRVIHYDTASGAFEDTGTTGNRTGTSGSTDIAVSFDASRSNPIYGNSDHVTPETAIVLFGVYAFGEITNVGALDADTLATGLATVEANLSEKLEKSTVHIVETWSSGSSWYRKWSDGWIEQGGTFTTTTTSATKTFVLPFSSTDYYLSVSDRANESDTGGYADVKAGINGEDSYDYGQSTTGFRLSTMSSIKISWYACGY